jgi:hypothetical protein
MNPILQASRGRRATPAVCASSQNDDCITILCELDSRQQKKHDDRDCNFDENGSEIP